MPEQIEHCGKVKKIIDDKTLIISIISTSACNHCDSKSLCSLSFSSEIKEKEVEVEVNNTSAFKLGQDVIVVAKQSVGSKAVLLGYVVPLLIMLFAVIVVFELYHSELWAAILGIIILVPYYFILYLYKDKLKNQFRFSVKEFVY